MDGYLRRRPCKSEENKAPLGQALLQLAHTADEVSQDRLSGLLSRGGALSWAALKLRALVGILSALVFPRSLQCFVVMVVCPFAWDRL